MQWLTSSRIAALHLLGAACLSACSQTAAPSGNGNTIDLAYAALVADIANCSKEVKTCTDAAADHAAVDACRADFASCREAAGKPVVDRLASAVRSCTSAHKECVRSAGHGEAGSCQDDLRTCLRAAHPETGDDEDAGADTDGRKAARSDCLDELHPCVKADGPANVCAEKVRTCLVESVPEASDVVPESDADLDDDADEAEESNGSGKPAADAGTAHGKSGEAKNDRADAGAGNQGKGKASEARMCVDSLRACVDSGSSARDCAKSLKECRTAARP